MSKVPGIPQAALNAIKDENARLVLQAIVDGLNLRNGFVGKGEDAFVTRAEMEKSAASGAVFRSFMSAAKNTLDASEFLKPGQVSQIITDLQAQVMNSLLFQDLGERINLIDTTVVENGNLLTQEIEDRTNGDNSILQSTATQISAINGNVAAIQQTQTTQANTISSISSSVQTLQATAGNLATAIQQEATARANADGTITSKYTVKIDTNGYVTGYGLISEANNSVPFSQFVVRSDQFAIGSPSGPGIPVAIPFIVTTTPSAYGPPGVYMNMAVIGSASIDSAKIADGAITSAKIGTAAIDTAHIKDLSVDSIKIKGGAVVTDKLNDGAVVTNKITNNSVTVPLFYEFAGGMSNGNWSNGYYTVGTVTGSFNVAGPAVVLISTNLINDVDISWFVHVFINDVLQSSTALGAGNGLVQIGNAGVGTRTFKFKLTNSLGQVNQTLSFKASIIGMMK